MTETSARPSAAPVSSGGSEHALHERTRLPEAYAWLEREHPRADWPTLRLHAAARFWLERHAWFRTTQVRMVEQGRRFHEGGSDSLGFARATLPALSGFLQHLDGHHRIESEHYFPAMAVQEPRMQAGFDLLDRDHETIHQILAELAEAAVALQRALAAGSDAPAAAARLAAVIEGAGRPLTRHLDDEEDIVVPMLTRYGDPFELADAAR